MVSNKLIAFLVIVVTLLLHGNNNTVVEAQLSQGFYSSSCPLLLPTVRTAVSSAILRDPGIGASILRLFYLDCFVNGCDASVLLDDTASFRGEKNVFLSARGFEVIDSIKSAVESSCPGVVSCADILAIAAKDSVELHGGPRWQLLLGRRDAITPNLTYVFSMPEPIWSLSQLISSFSNLGFTTREMVALSGAHTIGRAHCSSFEERINRDTNIAPDFAAAHKLICRMTSSSADNSAPLDYLTPLVFDSSYFRNLMSQRGLLHSDQELFNGGSTDSIVREYSLSLTSFRSDFAAAMLKMSIMSPLTGSDGEVRKSCRRIN